MGDSVMKVVGGMKGLQVVEIVRCSIITGKGIYYLARSRDSRLLAREGMKELRKLRLRKLYALQNDGFNCSDEHGSSGDGVKNVGGADSGGRAELGGGGVGGFGVVEEKWGVCFGESKCLLRGRERGHV